jgi:methionyl-tRNA synthetase
MSNRRNAPTLSAKSHRWQESLQDEREATCSVCGTPKQGGDACDFCGEGHDPAIVISMQYAEAQKWQAQIISEESEEYWRATR